MPISDEYSKLVILKHCRLKKGFILGIYVDKTYVCYKEEFYDNLPSSLTQNGSSKKFDEIGRALKCFDRRLKSYLNMGYYISLQTETFVPVSSRVISIKEFFHEKTSQTNSPD